MLLVSRNSLVITLALLFAAVPALADTVSSSRASLMELSREGRHFEVLVVGEDVGPAEFNLAEKLAVAQSAWALGLVRLARAVWDEVLADRDFVGPERYRTLLSRAILELQEENYDQARMFAERAAAELEPSDLRSQFYLVIAEALRAQGVYGHAERYYKRAADEGGEQVQEEANFLLGECQMKISLVDDARYNFAATESNSPYAAQALFRLAEVDFKQRNYEGVLTWLGEGFENYGPNFKEPWVYYMQTVALTELGRMEDAEQSLRELKKQFSNKGNWYALAEAALESRFAIGMPKLAKSKKYKEGL